MQRLPQARQVTAGESIANVLSPAGGIQSRLRPRAAGPVQNVAANGNAEPLTGHACQQIGLVE